MPGWGLTVLLPQAIGVRRAREMSFTGNFLDADEALQFGLVNHVVAHEELIPFTRSLAADIIGNDQAGVRQIRATYAEVVAHDDRRGLAGRGARRAAPGASGRSAPSEVARRRDAIMERGRTQ